MYNTANTVLARGQNKTHPCILNTKLILLMLYRRVQKLDCFAVSLVCSSFCPDPIQVKKRKKEIGKKKRKNSEHWWLLLSLQHGRLFLLWQTMQWEMQRLSHCHLLLPGTLGVPQNQGTQWGQSLFDFKIHTSLKWRITSKVPKCISKKNC